MVAGVHSFIYTVLRILPWNFRGRSQTSTFSRVQENETVKVVGDGKEDNLLSTAQKVTFKTCTSHRESAFLNWPVVPAQDCGHCSFMQNKRKINGSKR